MACTVVEGYEAEKGAEIRPCLRLVDRTGEPADATAVALSVTLPDGSNVTPSVAHVTVGEYVAVYDAAAGGRHVFKYAATGPVTAVRDNPFRLRSLFD